MFDLINIFISELEDQLDMFKYLTEGVILTLVSTFGFIGNTMSVIVLTRTATGLR